MRAIGIGFPLGFPVPTAVSECGDGVHVISRVRRGRPCPCRCGGTFATPHAYLPDPLPDRILVLDAVLDDVAIGDEKDCRFSDGTVRWAGSEVPA